MINSLALNEVIHRNGETQQALADALGISVKTLNRKINNKRDFFQAEIVFIVRRYDLGYKEIEKIFFPEVQA